MNTAASTSEIAMIGFVICDIALRVASFGGRCSSRMMRSTDSMTTMASSTTIPMASTMPNKVSWLIEKSKTIHADHRAHERHRHDQRGNQRGAEALQEHEHHDEHQHHRDQQRDLMTSWIAVVMNLVESKGNEPLDARRKAALQLVHARLDLLRHFECVRAGLQQHAEAGHRLVVEPHIESISRGTELDARDVFEPNARAVRLGAKNDVFEFGHRREAAFGGHLRRDLLAWQRRTCAQ